MNQTRNISRRLAQAAGTLAVAAGSFGLASGVAHAAPGAVAEVPAAGVPISCAIGGQPVSLLTTSGTLHIVNQMQQDATGSYHWTGTVSLQNVSATGSDGNTYSVVGASWYGGNGADPSTAPTRATDEFNIIGPNGKVASIHAEVLFTTSGVTGHINGTCDPIA